MNNEEIANNAAYYMIMCSDFLKNYKIQKLKLKMNQIL